MDKINFVKMNGVANDFVIIDNRKNHYQFSISQIIKIANRKNIGCDQFILLEDSSKADIFMNIYNMDGSKSGACGNATRCVAHLIMKEKNCYNITIQTTSDILECKKDNDLIAVNMGQPKLSWQEIPIAKKVNTDSFKISHPALEKYEFSAVNMGNPHIITFIKHEISNEDFFQIGALIENHQLFPEKTNMEFARIIDTNHIKARVWERGVGETLSCGSGACAIGVMAMKKGLIKRKKVKISFKGGDLFINWNKDNQVIMSGDYNIIFYGTFDKTFLETKNSS